MSNETFLNDTKITLTGLIIGDGWTDPINQLNYYDSYLWSIGVIDIKFREVCSWYQTKSLISFYEGNYEKAM